MTDQPAPHADRDHSEPWRDSIWTTQSSPEPSQAATGAQGDERVRKYEAAVRYHEDQTSEIVRAVMAVVDAEQIELWAEIERLRHALHDIVDILGPDRICECAPHEDCFLREEATDALRTARAALDGTQ
jgi:hypothetical protein